MKIKRAQAITCTYFTIVCLFFFLFLSPQQDIVIKEIVNGTKCLACKHLCPGFEPHLWRYVNGYSVHSGKYARFILILFYFIRVFFFEHLFSLILHWTIGLMPTQT